MIRVPITADEMLTVLTEVNSVLPKYALTESLEAARIVRLFREALLPYDGEAVRGAMKIGLRTWEKFPAPAVWRTAVHEWIKHNRPPLASTEDVPRDGEGRAIICLTCRSVARSAWHRRHDGTEYSRLIAPCNPERHSAGERLTPMPDNFLAWDDRTAEQHVADNERATKAKR